MKKIIIYFSFSLLMAGLLTGCYYDEVAVFDGLPQNVSLKNDVMPIFTKNCSNAGCHDAAGSHSPKLDAVNGYNALITGSYVNTVDPESSILYKEINGNSMPPSGPMSTNDKKLILAWITEGAKNN